MCFSSNKNSKRKYFKNTIRPTLTQFYVTSSFLIKKKNPEHASQISFLKQSVVWGKPG
jgi:hypothetical protein